METRNEMRRKRAMAAGLCIVMALEVSIAQNSGLNGINGINTATNMITSYFDPVSKLILAIGAIVGLIGGIKVYNKFSSGDPDTGKVLACWAGACIFLLISGVVLRSFFL